MLSILFLCISIIFIIQLYDNNSEGTPPSQWALNNYGQDVQGNQGLDGVDLDAEYIWSITKGDENVKVGILDTGINTGLTNISNNILSYGYNFYDDTTKIYNKFTTDYHGTMIASIISGVHNRENPVWGIAPDVSILPLKFMERREGNINDAISAIEYASDHGVQIINCSWDTEVFNQDLYEIIKSNKDILFIASSGKKGLSTNSVPVYPAAFQLDNVLSVGALNNDGSKTELSGYGNLNTIYAPGGNIIVLDPDGKVTYAEGASFATAYVTGVAALVISEFNNLSPIEIGDLLKNQISNDIKILNTKTLFNDAETLSKLKEQP